VINVADGRALPYEGSRVYVPFEDPNDPLPDLGINGRPCSLSPASAARS
jgi:hypothetical protein